MFNFLKRSSTPVPKDWKEQVREWQAEQQREKNLAEQRAKRIADEETAKNMRALEQTRQARIAVLTLQFECHCCHKKPTGPKRVGTQVDHGTPWDPYTTTEYEDDWSQPDDLFQCNTCRKWTCSDCLLEGMCKDDWATKIGQKLM